MLDPATGYQLGMFVSYELKQTLPVPLMEAMRDCMPDGLQTRSSAESITASIVARAAAKGVTLHPDHIAVIRRNVEKILLQAGISSATSPGSPRI